MRTSTLPTPVSDQAEDVVFPRTRRVAAACPAAAAGRRRHVARSLSIVTPGEAATAYRESARAASASPSEHSLSPLSPVLSRCVCVSRGGAVASPTLGASAAAAPPPISSPLAGGGGSRTLVAAELGASLSLRRGSTRRAAILQAADRG